MGKFVDLTGKRFGKLTVIKRIENRGRLIYWKCKCDCGNYKDVSGGNLKSGQVTSCGCARAGIKTKNIKGKRFGRLVVESYVGKNNNNQAVWHCKCDCGNEKDIVATNLLLGKTKSCGCLSSELTSLRSVIDMTGLKIGKWTVISRDYDRQLKSKNKKVVYWKCRCECGNIKSISATSLRHGDTLSCGCESIAVRGSKDELEIKNYIISKFPNIKLEKNHRILDGKEIDIYIPSKSIGIEYNGSYFHCSDSPVSHKDKYYHLKKFISAKNHGIHLISIFDIDYILFKDEILKYIYDVLSGEIVHYVPKNKYVYTDNDYDDGEWLKYYGYKFYKYLEPLNYLYKNKYHVYRSGISVWCNDNTEVTNEIAKGLLVP